MLRFFANIDETGFSLLRLVLYSSLFNFLIPLKFREISFQLFLFLFQCIPLYFEFSSSLLKFILFFVQFLLMSL